jgi:restriction endonuclease Mrr
MTFTSRARVSHGSGTSEGKRAGVSRAAYAPRRIKTVGQDKDISGFSKECTDAAIFPGAAPITLINGTKLIEMLEEYEIGMKNRHVDLLEIDKDFFEVMDVETAVEEGK